MVKSDLVLSSCGFKPNFSTEYSVVVDQSIEKVFPVIGTSLGFDSVTHLSRLCTSCAVVKADSVAVPASISLADTHVRTLPASEDSSSASPTQRLPRAFFTLTERTPVVFGLLHMSVVLNGTLTWDVDAKLALYESETASAITVKIWKLRKFEVVERNKTKVTEIVQGRCPFWIQRTVSSQCSTAHVAHMEAYHTLF